MICPRCGTDAHVLLAAPRPGAAVLVVDTCGGCGGLWLDSAELAPALAVLGALPHRMKEIARTAAPGSFACPLCRGRMLAFDLLGTPIDMCRDCGGVWLDGGELAAIAARAADPDTAPSLAGAPKEVACRGCGAVTPFGEMYYSDRGLVCDHCHATGDTPEAMDRRVGAGIDAYFEKLAAEERAARSASARRPFALRDVIDWLVGAPQSGRAPTPPADGS